MTESVAIISSGELSPGVIAGLFSNGVKVVILKDDRIPDLWNEICERELDTQKSNAESHILNESIFTIGQHHCQNNLNLGDMLRFTPGAIAHFGRKVKIFHSAESSRIEKFPRSYYKENGTFLYPEDVLGKVWQIMEEIGNGVFPAKNTLSNYAVNIEIVRYPKSVKELTDIFSLLENSSGKWSRLGHRLDAQKSKAKGIFNHVVLRDCFALGSLIPGVRTLLQYIDENFCKGPKDSVPKNMVVIGADHTDGAKLLTCLAAKRDNIVTQIFSGKEWIDLPLDSKSLAIFPGQQILKVDKFTPTRHRILMKESPSLGGDKSNISLMFSIVDR